MERTENEPYKEPPDLILKAVSDLVSPLVPTWMGSPSELASAANINMAVNALTKYLNVKYGNLLDEYSIRYENKAKHAGRQVVLTFTPTGESKNKS